MRIERPLIPLFTALSLSLSSTQVSAESEILPVYAIVAGSLGSVYLGAVSGNSVVHTFTSGTKTHQLAFLQGRQDDELSISRLALRWEHQLPVWQSANWRVQSVLESSYGYWQLATPHHPNRNQDIGLTPLFKWQMTSFPHLYTEVGVGVHFLEYVSVKGDNKSTQFQFGDQLGIGWENNQFRLGYRYLHVSNGNIELPNPSTDFHSVEIGYRF